MSIVGHAAARGEFLDIPPFLRGVAVALAGEDGPKIELSRSMYEEIHRLPDKEDPTEIVDEYFYDWWNRWSNYPNEVQVMVDYRAGFRFHGNKVSFCLLDVLFVDRSRSVVRKDTRAVPDPPQPRGGCSKADSYPPPLQVSSLSGPALSGFRRGEKSQCNCPVLAGPR